MSADHGLAEYVAGDNAVAENFYALMRERAPKLAQGVEGFATLKKELVRDCAYDTRTAARSDVLEYIEVFYNRQRAHSFLNYETPAHLDGCAENTKAAQSLTTRPEDRINFISDLSKLPAVPPRRLEITRGSTFGSRE